MAPSPYQPLRPKAAVAWPRDMVHSSPYAVEDAQPQLGECALIRCYFSSPWPTCTGVEKPGSRLARPPNKAHPCVMSGKTLTMRSVNVQPWRQDVLLLACLPPASSVRHAQQGYSADRLPFLFMVMAISLLHSACWLAQKGRGLSLLEHSLTLHEGLDKSAPDGSAISRFLPGQQRVLRKRRVSAMRCGLGHTG